MKLDLQDTKVDTLQDNAKNWLILNQDFWFMVDGNYFRIPKGFEWDGASIPRPFWPEVGADTEPDLQVPSLLHDWLYLTHHIARNVADDVFYQAMRMTTVSAFRARIMWAAVRAFGGLSRWANKDADRKEISEIIGMIAKRPDASSWAAESNFLRTLL